MTVHDTASAVVDLQSVLFKCSESRACPVGPSTNVGLLQHQPAARLVADQDGSSAVVNVSNKKFP